MKTLAAHNFKAVNMDTIGVDQKNLYGICPLLKQMYKDDKPGVSKCQLHVDHGGLCALTNIHIIKKWFKCYYYV